MAVAMIITLIVAGFGRRRDPLRSVPDPFRPSNRLRRVPDHDYGRGGISRVSRPRCLVFDLIDETALNWGIKTLLTLVSHTEYVFF